MSTYMKANPNRLAITVNSRTYQGSDNTLVQVEDCDVPMATANGWTVLEAVEVDALVALAQTNSILSTDVAALQAADNLPVTGVPLPLANDAAGNISWNMAQSTRGLIDLGANANVLLPTNIPNGGRAVLIVTQNTGSNWPMGWNGAFKFGSGGNSAVTRANGACDIFEFECDLTRLLCVAASKNVT